MMIAEKKTGVRAFGIIIAVLILIAPLSSESRGDFLVWDQHDGLPGTRYDADIMEISEGSIHCLHSYGTSAVHISGGEMGLLRAFDSSTVHISGGGMYVLYANNNSTVTISGGGMGSLFARDNSTVIFIAREFDFDLGDGQHRFSLDGNRLFGTSMLHGEWYDGLQWTIIIGENSSGVTILATPEPATLWLLTLGSFIFLRRRQPGRLSRCTWAPAVQSLPAVRSDP